MFSKVRFAYFSESKSLFEIEEETETHFANEFDPFASVTIVQHHALLVDLGTVSVVVGKSLAGNRFSAPHIDCVKR